MKLIQYHRTSKAEQYFLAAFLITICKDKKFSVEYVFLCPHYFVFLHKINPRQPDTAVTCIYFNTDIL